MHTLPTCIYLLSTADLACPLWSVQILDIHTSWSVPLPASVNRFECLYSVHVCAHTHTHTAYHSILQHTTTRHNYHISTLTHHFTTSVMQCQPSGIHTARLCKYTVGQLLPDVLCKTIPCLSSNTTVSGYGHIRLEKFMSKAGEKCKLFHNSG